MRRVLPPLLLFLAAVMIWEAAVRVFLVPSYIFPSFGDVARAAWEKRAHLGSAAQKTFLSASVAFLVSITMGTLGAVLVSMHPWVERAFTPYLLLFQAVPILTLAPLVVIVVGPGFAAVVVVAVASSIVPVLAGGVAGLVSTPPGLLHLFRLYGASFGETLIKLKLPWALPSLFTGCKVAGGLCVVGTVIGEYMVGMGGTQAGLGFVIVEAAARLQVPLLFAATLLASLVGAVFFMATSALARVLLGPWHESEKRNA